jgi:hypothetical protein
MRFEFGEHAQSLDVALASSPKMIDDRVGFFRLLQLSIEYPGKMLVSQRVKWIGLDRPAVLVRGVCGLAVGLHAAAAQIDQLGIVRRLRQQNVEVSSRVDRPVDSESDIHLPKPHGISRRIFQEDVLAKFVRFLLLVPAVGQSLRVSLSRVEVVGSEVAVVSEMGRGRSQVTRVECLEACFFCGRGRLRHLVTVDGVNASPSRQKDDKQNGEDFQVETGSTTACHDESPERVLSLCVERRSVSPEVECELRRTDRRNAVVAADSSVPVPENAAAIRSKIAAGSRAGRAS